MSYSVTNFESSLRVYNLPADLNYPIRVIATHITRGQKVEASAPFYTLSDAKGYQFSLQFAESGIVAETPVPVGSIFDGPVPVAYVNIDLTSQPAADNLESTKDGDLPKAVDPSHKSIEELILELDETATSKTWIDYKMSLERHLREHNLTSEEARHYAEDESIKTRWQTLNMQSNHTSSPTMDAPLKTESSNKNDPASPANQKQQVFPPNNYRYFVLALVLGAVATAIYGFLASIIPLAVIGVIIPFIFSWFMIFLSYNTLRGDRPYRIIASCTGIVLNLLVLWFMKFGMIWSFEDAIAISSSGLPAIFETIIYISENGGISVGSLTDGPNSGLEISGNFLLGLWIFEALALSSAIVFAYTTAADEQEISSAEVLKENAGNMKTELLPGLAGLFIATVKGTIPVLIIFGIVYMINEYL